MTNEDSLTIHFPKQSMQFREEHAQNLSVAMAAPKFSITVEKAPYIADSADGTTPNERNTHTVYSPVTNHFSGANDSSLISPPVLSASSSCGWVRYSFLSELNPFLSQNYSSEL